MSMTKDAVEVVDLGGGLILHFRKGLTARSRIRAVQRFLTMIEKSIDKRRKRKP